MRALPFALAFALLVVSRPAFAIEQTTPQAGTSSPKTTAELLSDLHSDDAPDRLYAARALKSQLTRALKVESRAREGSIMLDDARSVLVELDARLPRICMDNLVVPAVSTTCAEMLALLGVEEARAAIEELAQRETRKSHQRRLARALLWLDAA